MIYLADGPRRQFRSLLRRPKCVNWEGWLDGMEASPENRIRVAGKRIEGGELLIVATNMDDAGNGLNLFRKRWGNECMFDYAKTRGFNIEDPKFTDPYKLATLFVLVALAVTWAYRCATCAIDRRTIRKKRYGRREKSRFRSGLDALRKWIIQQPDKTISAWVRTCPKLPVKTAK